LRRPSAASHRKIGQEMGCFALDAEYVGPGMPLCCRKGTAIVEELEKLARKPNSSGLCPRQDAAFGQGENV